MRDIVFVKNFVRLFSEKRISQSAAALCYYLSMTLLPLLIIAYSILDRDRKAMLELLMIGEHYLPGSIMPFIKEYLLYVDSGDFSLMLPLALALFMSYAAAAFRVLQRSVGSLQGGTEHSGAVFFAVSFVYSLMLVAAMYFSGLIILTGRGAAAEAALLFPGISFIFENRIFAILSAAVLSFALLSAVYHLPKRKSDSYSVIPGAAVTSAALIVISPVFSGFISRSVKYPLVYGSLASFILMMIWLYMCCLALCAGAVFNVCLYETKKARGH